MWYWESHILLALGFEFLVAISLILNLCIFRDCIYFLCLISVATRVLFALWLSFFFLNK